jgi:hypothetical protein
MRVEHFCYRECNIFLLTEQFVLKELFFYDVFSNSIETERSFDALDSKTGNYFYFLKAVSYKKC